MEFMIKCVVFCLLIAVSYGKSVSLSRSISDISDDTNCSCDYPYLKHYEVKGCFVIQEDSCGCPKKFSCQFNQTVHAPSKVCTYHSKEYKVGSKIVTSDDCKVCRCYDGTPPFISCMTKECGYIEGAPGNNCHLIYKENNCCPTGYKCLENESEIEIANNQTCEYNGRLYPFGSRIYPVEDSCQICNCNEDWNGTDSSSCYQRVCTFEIDKSQLDRGCIPVYHENLCCPVEFYCPSSHNSTYSLLHTNESDNNVTYDDYCVFDGQFYKFGEELPTNLNPCVKCSCNVPPDFTCVHQSCPSSPNEENCYPVYSPEQCCPSYDCLLGDAEAVSDADACPTPLCADSSCRIEIPPGHDCPTCVCGERSLELEHNNLQEVQQIGQNFEPIQQVFEGPRESIDDYSEDELQMIPISIQGSERQNSVMEKIILPESGDINQYVANDATGIEENATINTSDAPIKVSTSEEQNISSLAEIQLNDTAESLSNQSEKNVQKRSDASDEINIGHTRIHQRMQKFNEDIEREGGDDTVEDFDEFENFKNRILNKSGTVINEINLNRVVRVPVGCPTPMCEGPWCKIGIPHGKRCPTCICQRHEP